ncbi:Ig-like domain-containing protein, partial [Pseudomonas sp. D1HM]
DPSQVVSPDIDPADTTAPDAPTNLSVSPNGGTVSGKGEPGTTVTIKDPQGNTIGTGTVGADGNFAVGLNPPQVNGEVLDVTLTDAAGNISDPAQVVSADIDFVDTTAPDAPTNLVVTPNGVNVSGKGEAGTTVHIRDDQGNLLGTGTVGADGNFSVDMDTPKINGELLSVTLTDAARNISDPSQVNSADIDETDADADADADA